MMQSPELNLTEMLCWDLKTSVLKKKKPTNLDELKELCEEESAKIPLQSCERLIKSEKNY